MKLQSTFSIICEIDQDCLQENCSFQVFTSRNKAIAIWDPQNKLIVSIEDTQNQASPKFQLSYPNTLRFLSPQYKPSRS